jgi:hypothetical protein
MNWAASGERRQLADQGFDLPSLDPVIDVCCRTINEEGMPAAGRNSRPL